jgi:hypothetical protein
MTTICLLVCMFVRLCMIALQFCMMYRWAHQFAVLKRVFDQVSSRRRGEEPWLRRPMTSAGRGRSHCRPHRLVRRPVTLALQACLDIAKCYNFVKIYSKRLKVYKIENL